MAPAPPKDIFEWSRAYFRNGDRALNETRGTMAALMTYANGDLVCFPSQRRLAEDTGVHHDTVGRHLKKNIEAGWLVVVERGNSFKNTTTYRLSTPRTGAGELPALVQSTPRTAAGVLPAQVPY
ncbi:hypothetical protein B1R94_22150 [Mycolicibacterium litorale]|nr:hypothetical protein B1R94_22150 [Mycolicibacterium litorale]